MDTMSIKGYYVYNGYKGHIGNGEYMLFASEQDYLDWVE